MNRALTAQSGKTQSGKAPSGKTQLRRSGTAPARKAQDDGGAWQDSTANRGARATADTAPLSEAFGQIYADHFALVVRGLRRLGVPEAALEDAVQDVFVVVHRRGSDFEGRSELRTWVYGIAVRVAKDYRRAAARHSRRVQRLAELSQAEPAAVSPSDRVERREANRLLHLALGDLMEEERALFVLVELEELSMREAAQALNLNLRTCQRRLKRARESFEVSLRELLASRSPS